MSQRSRPDTGQKDAQAKRMPFEAAEALLWGKATFEQHEFLYKRMQDLTEEHSVYDTRIRAIEAIGEAAEAATSRVRHVEQQIVAIQADEHDKPFNNWVTAEISGLKSFIEQNKHVRQRLIQLEKQVTTFEDDLSRAVRATKAVDGLLRRLDEMETKRSEDADRMEWLEKDVTHLTTMNGNSVVENNRLLAALDHKRTCERLIAPAAGQADPIPSDQTEETEDENNHSSQRRTTHEFQGLRAIQNHDGQQTKSTSAVPLPPTKTQNSMSARLRMMQRKSIFDPKMAPKVVAKGSQAPVPVTDGPEARRKPMGNALADTQIVARPINGHQAATEHPKNAMKDLAATQMIVRLPINAKKRKLIEIESVPRLTRSQVQAQSRAQAQASEQDKKHAQAQVRVKAKAKTKASVIDGHVIKRQKTDTRQVRAAAAASQTKEVDIIKSTECVPSKVSPVKAPRRKVALPPSPVTCNPCLEANAMCDRAQPTCGNCKKRRQNRKCIYQAAAQLPEMVLSPAQRQIVPMSDETLSSGSGLPAAISSRVPFGSKAKKESTMKNSLKKAKSPKKSDIKTTTRRECRSPVAKAGFGMAGKSVDFPITMATPPDWETYQEMVRQGLVNF